MDHALLSTNGAPFLAGKLALGMPLHPAGLGLVDLRVNWVLLVALPEQFLVEDGLDAVGVLGGEELAVRLTEEVAVVADGHACDVLGWREGDNRGLVVLLKVFDSEVFLVA